MFLYLRFDFFCCFGLTAALSHRRVPRSLRTYHMTPVRIYFPFGEERKTTTEAANIQPPGPAGVFPAQTRNYGCLKYAVFVIRVRNARANLEQTCDLCRYLTQHFQLQVSTGVNRNTAFKNPHVSINVALLMDEYISPSRLTE